MMDNISNKNRQGARSAEACAGSQKDPASLLGSVKFWTALPVEGEHMPGWAVALEDAGLISEAEFSARSRGGSPGAAGNGLRRQHSTLREANP